MRLSYLWQWLRARIHDCPTPIDLPVVEDQRRWICPECGCGWRWDVLDGGVGWRREGLAVWDLGFSR